VLRDRAVRQLALITVALIAIGWGVFTWLVPPYARNDLGLSTWDIGLLLLANTVTVVIAQVPVAKLAEGRRRVVLMALAAFLFAGACLLVAAAGAAPHIAFAILVVACVAVGLGECCYTTVLTPLTAELAPQSLRGRYLALIGFSWWIGLALAPTLGAPLLSRAPVAPFLVAAALACGTAALALRLERSLPDASRLTPQPARVAMAGREAR
jgi:MFS family permease